MAHCVNCDVLISDNPEHEFGDYCSDECRVAYRAGASQEKLSIAEKAELNKGPLSRDSNKDQPQGRSNPDIKGFSFNVGDSDKVNE